MTIHTGGTTRNPPAIVLTSMTHTRFPVCLAWLLLAVCSTAAAQAPDPVRTITPLRGNLYRAQDGPRVTVFRVDADGIVLVDPMNFAFARFLQQEFDQRFPGRPVKYVIYSGVDLERVGGAGVFDTTAEIVAHREFNDRSTAARRDRPELSERQMYAEAGFGSRRTLYDGNAPIDLVYAGSGIVGAQTLVYFRNERVLFASTHPSLTAPFSNRDMRAPAVAQWTATAGEIEFDVMLDGRGDTTTRADVLAAGAYVKGLMAGMADGNVRGLSAEQVRSSASVGRFEGTPFAQVRDGDIAALYQRTRLLALDASVAALATHVPTDTVLCSRCSTSSGTGPGLFAAGGFTVGRWKGVAEFTTATAVNTEEGDFTFRTKERHLTFLGGFRLRPSARIDVTPLGGLTWATAHFDYAYRPSSFFFGGQTGDGDEERFALTFGADVVARLAERLAVVVPLRFTPAIDIGQPRAHNGLAMKAGVGLAFTYHRRAM